MVETVASDSLRAAGRTPLNVTIVLVGLTCRGTAIGTIVFYFWDFLHLFLLNLLLIAPFVLS